MKKLISLLTVFCVSGAFAAGVKTGDMAPDFTLSGADGKSYKLSQFKGKVVILEWFNNECPYVKKFYDGGAMQGMQDTITSKGNVWLSINSSAPGKEGHATTEKALEISKTREMKNTAFLLDEKGEVGKLYGAKTTPHMFIVDKDGRLVYQGAMDDRPSTQRSSLKGSQNYLVDALMAMEKGQAIKNGTTAPYGCSVKY